MRKNKAKNFVKIDYHVVSHLPARVCNGREYLVDPIMNPFNCRTSRITVSLKGNADFITPEPVYVYTDIKPNFVGDSYVKLLTTLHILRVHGIIDLSSLCIDL